MIPPSPDTEFFDHLRAGRFMIQRGVESGRFVYYPRIAEPGSGKALEWAEVSGLGTVYSATAIGRKPPEPAYNVALVDLDEGVRVMSRVEGLPAEAVTIGMRVKARIVDEGGMPLVVFDPVDDQA